ncbi:MAG: glycosyltransferase [Candidatus Staskawiczbacteria bacterium]|nr:glycosyltransferase [Candidatus Staskawiczbacteria bacterium]
MNYPLVSIIIPTYNGEKYLGVALDSILRQTYKNIEIIIINDGAIDGTEDVIKKFTEKDPRVIRIKNESNLGFVKSLNKGVGHAKGKYIARLDDDDSWISPQKLEKQVGFLEEHPEYVLAGGGLIQIDSKGEEMIRYLFPEKDEDIRRVILVDNIIAHSSVVFRKDAFDKVGGYDEKFGFFADRDLWLKLGKIGKCYNFPEHFIFYLDKEWDTTNYNSRNEQIRRKLKLNIALRKKYRYDYPGFYKSLLLCATSYIYSFLPFRKKIWPALFRLRSLMLGPLPYTYSSTKNQIKEPHSKREVIGRRVFKIAAFFFIFLGIFLNWYTISQLLYGIDILSKSQKIFITILDVAFIFVGYLFWRIRNNFEKQNNFILLFLTIAVCLLATEGVLHVISPRSVSHPVISLFTVDCPVKVPYCVKPNLDIKTKIGFDDLQIKTNSFGMAGEEFSIENVGNKKRIALLGDSFLFGLSASSFKNSFAGIISENSDEKKFEVLNFGVPGFGQVQEAMLLREQVIKFKPAYAVLFFTNTNDMVNNYLGEHQSIVTKEGTTLVNQEVYKEKMGIKVTPESTADDQGKNGWFLRIGHMGALKIKDSMNVVRNSYVYTYVYSFFQKSLESSKVLVDLNNFMSPMYWSRSDYPEVAVKAKNITIEEIDNIFTFCQKNNIKLSIVSIPFSTQVEIKNPIGAGYNIIYPQKYIEDYAKSKQIPYLDLLPELREYVKNNPSEELYNEADLHFNDSGHKITGNLVSDFLKNNFLPK